jgi:hypothetical protein
MGWPGKTLTPVHNSMQFVYTTGFALPAGNQLPTNSTACHYAFAPPPSDHRAQWILGERICPTLPLPARHTLCTALLCQLLSLTSFAVHSASRTGLLACSSSFTCVAVTVAVTVIQPTAA